MDCNVLIVGSGLAGASTAYHLRRLGVGGVTILERLSEAPFRRYHTICGEAVSDRLLRMADVGDTETICKVNTLSISSDDGMRIDVPISGRVIDRNALIRRLVSESGADVVRGSMLSADIEYDEYVVRTTVGEIRCKYLVGADGAFSTVRKHMFPYAPEGYVAIENCIVEGEPDDVLSFKVAPRYKGGYEWDFPSSEGRRSVGLIKGTGTIESPLERGVRFGPVGKLFRITDARCCLVGDAACLNNQFCFGGIGNALVSGKKAAEGIQRGDLRKYERWKDKDRAFDKRFIKAHREFVQWTDEDIRTAMAPFKDGYSLFKGMKAVLAHPGYRTVYMACWFGFTKGW